MMPCRFAGAALLAEAVFEEGAELAGRAEFATGTAAGVCAPIENALTQKSARKHRPSRAPIVAAVPTFFMRLPKFRVDRPRVDLNRLAEPDRLTPPANHP